MIHQPELWPFGNFGDSYRSPYRMAILWDDVDRSSDWPKCD